MTRDRLVSVFVILAASSVAIVVLWLAVFRHPRTIVHERPVITTPIVSSPVTPLPRDSGPKNNAVKKGRGGRSRKASSRLQRLRTPPPTQSRTRGGSQRRSPVKTRPTPRPKAKHPAPKPSAPSSGSPSPSPAPQPPLVGVTVPAPVSACVDRLAGVNCP